MAQEQLPQGWNWGQYRSRINSNATDAETRLQALEVTGGVIRSGADVPSNSLGNNSDYYIRDNPTNELYKKVSGSWVFQRNLKGDQGVQGNTGTAGRGFNPLGAYNAATTYAIDDIVTSRGKTYRSLQNNNLNNTPQTQPTWWELWANGYNSAGDWADATIYRIDDTVRYLGSWYRVLTNHTSTTADFPGSGTANAIARYAVIAAKGDQGIQGNTGATGPGVPTGGATGDSLVKTDATNFNTQWLKRSGYYAFRAALTANQSLPNNVTAPGTNLTGWTEDFEFGGNNFAASSGVFTAPVAGVYAFGGAVAVNVGDAGVLIYYLQLNGVMYTVFDRVRPGDTGSITAAGDDIIQLAVNDQVRVSVHQTNVAATAKDAIAGGANTNFWGYLVRAT